MKNVCFQNFINYLFRAYSDHNACSSKTSLENIDGLIVNKHDEYLNFKKLIIKKYVLQSYIRKQYNIRYFFTKHTIN